MNDILFSPICFGERQLPERVIDILPDKAALCTGDSLRAIRRSSAKLICTERMPAVINEDKLITLHSLTDTAHDCGKFIFMHYAPDKKFRTLNLMRIMLHAAVTAAESSGFDGLCLELSGLPEYYAVRLIEALCGLELTVMCRLGRDASHTLIRELRSAGADLICMDCPEPQDAGRLISSGACDIVSPGRALTADPDWCLKVKNGADSELRPCLGCELCRIDCMPPDDELNSAGTSKRIAVVGGGIYGMSLALYAARRGHRVCIFERGKRLGGSSDLRYVHWLTVQLSREKNFELRLNTEFGERSGDFELVLYAPEDGVLPDCGREAFERARTF